MTRIAMVSEHASPLAVLGGEDAGGQNVHVAELAVQLARLGHDVTVYTRRDDPALPEEVPFSDGVRVVHVPAGPPEHVPKDELLRWMPAFGDWLAAALARRPADVVHAHFWMSGLAAARAVSLLSRRRGGRSGPVPSLALTYHALGIVKRRHQGEADPSPACRIELERRLATGVDAVVATCSDEVNELLDLGAPLRRLHVVPCGVDADRFSPDRGTALPPGVGPLWRPGAARLLCLGRLVERKGIDTAIAALSMLPGAELVVAGGPAAGELDRDPDIRRLRSVAARAGVADRVHLAGRVDQSTAAALMAASDAVVCVPWYEPFGIVPLEAMACATPVVATAVGGMLDTVEDGVTGRLVPVRDPLALAAAVRDLLADPARRAAAGAAGRARVLERFQWSQVGLATEAVYADLLAEAGVRRLPPLTGTTFCACPGGRHEEGLEDALRDAARTSA